MNKKLLIHLVIFIVAAVGIRMVLTKDKNVPQADPAQDSKITGIYCSSDGTLTDTMPVQSHRSYCIKSDAHTRSYFPNTEHEYSFSIVDDQGNTLKDFAITHTKPMHVIVVRTDLATFEHIHPEYNSSTGWFTFKNLTFYSEGTYRIFADFAPANSMKDPFGEPLVVTLHEDITVGATYKRQPLGGEEKTKKVDSHEVVMGTEDPLLSQRESMLAFSIYENGKPVNDLEEYLGALGHSVILKENTLDFIHAHPVEAEKDKGMVSFMVSFPDAGKYKIFTQFQRNGSVFTTDFVVSVADGSETPDTKEPMQHTLH